MKQNEYNTQKSIIKIGDIVKFNELFTKNKHGQYAIVLDSRMFNKRNAKLIMLPDGSKEWIRKEKIEIVITSKGD